MNWRRLISRLRFGPSSFWVPPLVLHLAAFTEITQQIYLLPAWTLFSRSWSISPPTSFLLPMIHRWPSTLLSLVLAVAISSPHPTPNGPSMAHRLLWVRQALIRVVGPWWGSEGWPFALIQTNFAKAQAFWPVSYGGLNQTAWPLRLMKCAACYSMAQGTGELTFLYHNPQKSGTLGNIDTRRSAHLAGPPTECRVSTPTKQFAFSLYLPGHSLF